MLLTSTQPCVFAGRTLRRAVGVTPQLPTKHTAPEVDPRRASLHQLVLLHDNVDDQCSRDWSLHSLRRPLRQQMSHSGGPAEHGRPPVSDKRMGTLRVTIDDVIASWGDADVFTRYD